MSLSSEVSEHLTKVETPEGQFMAGEEHVSPAERAIIQRVIALSLEESQNKPLIKSNSLSLKYRKLITNMKMTKSSQKCTVCYSQFCEGEIIKRFPCKHIFHRQCAKSWLKIDRNCPNCRLDLELHFQRLETEAKLDTSVSKPKPQVAN